MFIFLAQNPKSCKIGWYFLGILRLGFRRLIKVILFNLVKVCSVWSTGQNISVHNIYLKP